MPGEEITRQSHKGVRLASDGAVTAHGVAIDSVGTRKDTGKEWAVCGRADRDERSRSRSRCRTRKTPHPQQTGASNVDAGAGGRGGAYQKTGCQVWDRPYGHRGASAAIFHLPRPPSGGARHRHRGPCRSAIPGKLPAPRRCAGLELERPKSSWRH